MMWVCSQIDSGSPGVTGQFGLVFHNQNKRGFLFQLSKQISEQWEMNDHASPPNTEACTSILPLCASQRSFYNIAGPRPRPRWHHIGSACLGRGSQNKVAQGFPGNSGAGIFDTQLGHSPACFKVWLLTLAPGFSVFADIPSRLSKSWVRRAFHRLL